MAEYSQVSLLKGTIYSAKIKTNPDINNRVVNNQFSLQCIFQENNNQWSLMLKLKWNKT